jgi:hypothetical protein
MKSILTWTVLPGKMKEAVDRFLSTGAPAQEGVTMLGRWHRADGSGGFALFESDRPEQLYRGAVQWADVLKFESHLVIEDAQAGPVLADEFKK